MTTHVKSDYRIEYTSPDGQCTIVLDPFAIDGPFFLLPTPVGMLSPSISFNTRKGPSQPGSTLTDSIVGERIMPVQFAILASNRQEYWDLREFVVGALSVPTNKIGELPSHGLLRIHRPGKPTVHVAALPRNIQEGARPDPTSLVVGFEFVAASPYWQEEEVQFVELKTEGGGFRFPMEMPWESIANNVQQEIVNTGSVATPIHVDLFGEFTNGRLINTTSGRMMEYKGTIPEGERVEIITDYGKKSVTRVAADGTRTPDIGSMDLDLSEFWTLVRNENVVRFEADSNPTGYARIRYQIRHGGI